MACPVSFKCSDESIERCRALGLVNRLPMVYYSFSIRVYRPLSRGSSNIGVDSLDSITVVSLEQLGSLGLGELELLDL